MSKKQTEQYLSPLEVAEQLSISRWTVYGWMQAGKIAFTKLGRLRRISQGEVDRLIAEGDEPTLEDRLGFSVKDVDGIPHITYKSSTQPDSLVDLKKFSVKDDPTLWFSLMTVFKLCTGEEILFSCGNPIAFSFTNGQCCTAPEPEEFPKISSQHLDYWLQIHHDIDVNNPEDLKKVTPLLQKPMDAILHCLSVDYESLRKIIQYEMGDLDLNKDLVN
jgi:excisionase family DNA binding protein